jgi:hypothetical protein
MEHMQVVRERSVAMTSARTAGTAVALTATLGLAAVSWVVAVREMISARFKNKTSMSRRGVTPGGSY